MPHNSVLGTLYPSYSSFLSSFSILFLMYQQLIASDTIFFFSMRCHTKKERKYVK